MPFLGLGLHILIALFFAVHALRTGRPMYWLIILFSFPLLGSIVYFIIEYLPNSRLEYGIRKAGAAAARSLDPGKELREAQTAFDLTPTAQNQMRLANALLEAGHPSDAVQHYSRCLSGPFADDPEIRFGAARARMENDDAAGAITLLEALRRDTPDYHPERVLLLSARAHACTGKRAEAERDFSAAASRFGSVEARAEYAMWALTIGDVDTAVRLHSDLNNSMRHWNKHTRSLHRPLIRKLDEAFAGLRR